MPHLLVLLVALGELLALELDLLELVLLFFAVVGVLAQVAPAVLVLGDGEGSVLGG